MCKSKPPVTPISETESMSACRKSSSFWRWLWLTFLVVSLAYAWYSFYAPSNRIAWADTLGAAQQRATESDKPIILFFTGKWCSPCQIMKRQVWADEQVAATVNAGFVPVTIDVDDVNAAETLRFYDVYVTPSTIITDSQGNVLQERQGRMSKADFLEMLVIINTAAKKDQPRSEVSRTDF